MGNQGLNTKKSGEQQSLFLWFLWFNSPWFKKRQKTVLLIYGFLLMLLFYLTRRICIILLTNLQEFTDVLCVRPSGGWRAALWTFTRLRKPWWCSMRWRPQSSGRRETPWSENAKSVRRRERHTIKFKMLCCYEPSFNASTCWCSPQDSPQKLELPHRYFISGSKGGGGMSSDSPVQTRRGRAAALLLTEPQNSKR